MTTARPSAEDDECLELLLADERCTTWEGHFMESLADHDQWTEKQAAKFDEIWERLHP